METFYFLCGNFENIYYVYAIKNDQSDWHYFEEKDSLLDSHVFLPPDLSDKIQQLKEVKPIKISLSVEQSEHYVNDGKFVFNGEELSTFIQLSGVSANQRVQRDQLNPSKNRKEKTTRNIVFEAGKTNPAIFLRYFERCSDLKTEKDKLYKLRNFVCEKDRQVFSTLYFKGDWDTARVTFLKNYSMEFTENKKRELSVRFEDESSLRSFVAKKMSAMASYTSLTLENQMEMILSELPCQIANIFIVEDKVSQTKADILDFCDLVQEHCEYTESVNTETTSLPMSPDVSENRTVQYMETFDYQRGVDSDTSSTSASSSGSRKVKRMCRSGRRRSGRPPKIPKTIPEELGDTDIDTESNDTDE